MIDFNIFHGLSTDLFSAPGVVNPDLLIEEGCWYLCTDTAELFLGTSDQEEPLKKVNNNIITQVTTSITKLEIVDGNLIATYSDKTVANLGKVVDNIPTNISVFTNDANYATEQYVIDAITAQVPVDDLAKKEEVENVKTKLEVEVLPTIQETILPTVQELAETAATREWVTERGYLTAHQSLAEYAKKAELFSGSYNDLTDKPVIPSTEGLASEQYVDAAISEIKYPSVDLSSYALKSEVAKKANKVLFTSSKLVTNAMGSFSVGDDVKGLTITEIIAKLLGLEASAEPENIVEKIVAYEIPMYTVASDGTLVEVPFNYMKFDTETAAAEPTSSGFYQIVDESGIVIESGYQEIQAYSNDIYYVITLPKEVDYNTMVTIQGYNTSLKVWAEVEKFEMTSDPAQVEVLCSEAGIDISHIDTSIYTVWASETCPTGSKLRYSINEDKEAA